MLTSKQIAKLVPAPLAGDVIERMCRAALDAPHRNDAGSGTFDEMGARTRKLWIDDMTAAARVLLDEVCVAVHEVYNPGVTGASGKFASVDRLIERIRARLEGPRTPEDRVMILPDSSTLGWSVFLDGEFVFGKETTQKDAQIYCLGLIAKLKAEDPQMT